MWQLKKLNEGNAVYHLISEQRCYVVGRKNCDLVFEGDSSVSRKHSTIYVTLKNDCMFPVDTFTGVWIVDENSKYGTFIKDSDNNEWRKLNGNEEVPLHHGAIIRFGLMENIWSLEYTPLIASTSGIQNDGKSQIIQLLKIIDGELRSSWSSDCNLIIVNEMTLTVKVVLAMINGVPIVKHNYLNDLINCIKNQQPLPDQKSYRPIISEAVLDTSQVSLDPTNTRKTLFKDKTFVFPTSKQLETLRQVVISAGGKAQLLNITSKNWQKLADRDIIVMQLPSNKTNISIELLQTFQNLTEYLQKNYGKRIVPESEIAQAIAYSSIQKYCNTISDAFEGKTIVEETQDLGDILVEETPRMTDKIVLDPCTVPCTMTQSELNDILREPQKGQKRCLPSDPDEPKRKVSRRKADMTQPVFVTDPLTALNPPTVSSVKSKTEEKTLKNSSITNYFKKQPEKMHQKEFRVCDSKPQDSGKFLTSTPVDTTPNKRKGREEKTFEEELQESMAKKLKLPKDTNRQEKDRSVTHDNSINVGFEWFKPDSQSEGKSTEPRDERLWKDNSFKTNKIEPDDFMELDKTVCHSTLKLSQHDNSVFSVDLISSIYLKGDGSLIDPPEKPINVKKFKKKNVLSKEEPLLRWEQNNLSEDGWIEVHPLNTSNDSIDGKYAW